MALEPNTERAQATARHLVEKYAPSDSSRIHASVCQGMAPMIVESPCHFFGVQLIAGLASLLVLALVEILR